MKSFVVLLALPLLAIRVPAQAASATAATPPSAQGTTDLAALFAALALTGGEREERLALALSVFTSGDCEGALTWLEAAEIGGADDEWARRVTTERTRVQAWIGLRDAFLAEQATGSKPLSLELDGKKVATTFTREGDELVLAKGPKKRLPVRELAPEMLLTLIPKERFAGANEWLKIYPYCVAVNPKWKRLTTSEAASAELKRDAEEFYPRLLVLAPSVRALVSLAQRAPPTEPAAGRAALAEIEALLALGRESACVRARLPALTTLATHLLALVSGAMELGELVHAKVSAADDGTPRIAYDFTTEDQAQDWRRDDDYLASMRSALEPVTAESSPATFPVHPQGFSANGTFCWQHALEFQAPMRVRYHLRWDPRAGQPKKVYSFALGMLGDAGERHVRVNELGFLYVDEQDGRYTAVRPTGNATVQVGQAYALELVHDGKQVEAWVDGTLRAEAEAPGRKTGHVFLWGHSDLLVSVSALEIEGQVTAAALAKLRADWANAELARLGLGSGR